MRRRVLMVALAGALLTALACTAAAQQGPAREAAPASTAVEQAPAPTPRRAAAPSAAADSGAPPTPLATQSSLEIATPIAVAARNLAFAPRTVTVAAGTTVTWTNFDSFEHTVTADDGSFDSGLFGQGETFSHTFSTPGTYPYYCIPHGGPGGAGMAGVVVVTEPQAALAAEAVATPAEAAAPASQSGDADSD